MAALAEREELAPVEELADALLRAVLAARRGARVLAVLSARAKQHGGVDVDHRRLAGPNRRQAIAGERPRRLEREVAGSGGNRRTRSPTRSRRSPRSRALEERVSKRHAARDQERDGGHARASADASARLPQRAAAEPGEMGLRRSQVRVVVRPVGARRQERDDGEASTPRQESARCSIARFRRERKATISRAIARSTTGHDSSSMAEPRTSRSTFRRPARDMEPEGLRPELRRRARPGTAD